MWVLNHNFARSFFENTWPRTVLCSRCDWYYWMHKVRCTFVCYCVTITVTPAGPITEFKKDQNGVVVFTYSKYQFAFHNIHRMAMVSFQWLCFSKRLSCLAHMNIRPTRYKLAFAFYSICLIWTIIYVKCYLCCMLACCAVVIILLFITCI